MQANYNSKRKLSAAQISDIYDKVEMHVASQIIALVMCTLEINYGWKGIRLKRFVSDLNATARLACKTNILGNEVDTDDLIQHLIDKYGIDCRAEVKGM